MDGCSSSFLQGGKADFSAPVIEDLSTYAV
jgi:hypothetical protein